MSVRQAVDALADWIEAQFGTYLQAISGTLATPTYVRSRRPYDNRTPLLQVYATSGRPYDDAGQRNRAWAVRCAVHLSMLGSASDSDGSQDTALAYHQALINCVNAYNDSQATGHSLILDEWASDDFGAADNQTRHEWAQIVEMRYFA